MEPIKCYTTFNAHNFLFLLLFVLVSFYLFFYFIWFLFFFVCVFVTHLDGAGWLGKYVGYICASNIHCINEWYSFARRRATITIRCCFGENHGWTKVSLTHSKNKIYEMLFVCFYYLLLVLLNWWYARDEHLKWQTYWFDCFANWLEINDNRSKFIKCNYLSCTWLKNKFHI